MVVVTSQILFGGSRPAQDGRCCDGKWMVMTGSENRWYTHSFIELHVPVIMPVALEAELVVELVRHSSQGPKE